jgi:hypothetical protein
MYLLQMGNDRLLALCKSRICLDLKGLKRLGNGFKTGGTPTCLTGPLRPAVYRTIVCSLLMWRRRALVELYLCYKRLENKYKTELE